MSLNVSYISYISLFFCKSCNSPWNKLLPLFQQPPLKFEVVSSPLLFENSVGVSASPPPPPAEIGGAHYEETERKYGNTDRTVNIFAWTWNIWKNCNFYEKLHSENDFETVWATFCCYDHGAKTSEAIQKIATDQKVYCKCSSYDII